MTDTTDLTTGVSRAELTRIVMEAHPELIKAMEKAGQNFYENEDAWQEEVAQHQRNAGMPRRSLESPFGKALRQAAVAVTEKFEAMLAAGEPRGPSRPTGTG
jgi:hypothetical protein